MKITICGSGRFADAIAQANHELSLAGHVVYSIVPLLDAPSDEQKVVLRRIHRQKIAASEAVWVVAVGGYIGPDTQSEINFAREQGKKVLP